MTTVDDLKAQYSMRDVVERYGFHPDRAGFIHCPFHTGDHTSSLKIYKDSFYCFGCHAHGDIISFVRLMDNCSFKDAVKSLGGDTSGGLTDAAIVRINKRKRERQKREKRCEDALKRMRYRNNELHYFEVVSRQLEPFSDMWCEVQDLLVVLRRRADVAVEKYLDILDDWG